MSDNLLLSVVEELKGIQSSQFIDEIYDPEFWLDFIPFRQKMAEKISDTLFTYEFEETFILDPTGTLRYDLHSLGKVEVLEDNQTDKGRFWKIRVTSLDPHAVALVNIRMKDLIDGIKVGFYVYELQLDLSKLDALGFGREAVIYATRTTLRKNISIFHKSLRHKKL
ncbi:MAG: hypothetical protein EU530_11260 [Promethearchaeota archaeon]|nr:MAG: hypothetical protein EU530_11260 [Candidatus Lokiarchaeota archaeon]